MKIEGIKIKGKHNHIIQKKAKSEKQKNKKINKKIK